MEKKKTLLLTFLLLSGDQNKLFCLSSSQFEHSLGKHFPLGNFGFHGNNIML